MTPFLVALQFMTRYPVRLSADTELSPRLMGASTRYFPLVGLLVGVDLLVARWVLQWAGVLAKWPLLGAALLLLYWVWVADSLHLDGLADTADGLSSSARSEELLAVMHDPRVGAFGAQATVLALILKFALLASLAPAFWWALPLPLISGRLLASLLCQGRPYAGRKGSLSGAFIEGSHPDDAGAAVGWAAFGFMVLSAGAVFMDLASARDCGLALGACAAGIGLGWLASLGPRRRLGGISGDFIGYSLQVAEIAAFCGLLFVGSL
jgi:adenosylcobinamide-GDP ribazoletransferase